MNESEYEEKKIEIQKNVLDTLEYWLTNYFEHFNYKLLQRLMDFLQNEVEGHPTLKHKFLDFSILIKELQEKESTETPVNLKNAPKPKVNLGKAANNIFLRDLFILEVDEEEVARQLCIIEYDMYKRIKVCSFKYHSFY